MMIRTRRCATAVALALSLGTVGLAIQETKSPSAAKQLTTALDAAKLDAIAAADPSEPGAFVAALYIQGSQLLVVSAKYAAPPLMLAKLKTKEYRDIYMDLSAASVAGSKLFIIDGDCNGLAAKPEGDNCGRQLGSGHAAGHLQRRLGEGQAVRGGLQEAVLGRRRAVYEDSGAADGAGEAVGVARDRRADSPPSLLRSYGGQPARAFMSEGWIANSGTPEIN